MKLIIARYVAPVGQAPITDGAVLIQGGKIVGVGPRVEFSSDSRIDYGDAVICPGFVNAHTHLELSGLRGGVPPDGDLAEWLGRLVPVMKDREQSQASIERDVWSAIAESIQSGVTLLGDITRDPGTTRPVLANSNVRGVSFGEVIAVGTGRANLEERVSNALPDDWHDERVRIGISPHAPYTVEPSGLAACVARSAAVDARLCIHLSESPEEIIFTESGTGALADHLKRLGVWDDAIVPAGCRPVELARRCGLLNKRTVCAHLNYVTDEEIAQVAASGASVAYCPRTHASFGHEPHRFRDLLRAGVTVAIGTDSLASNPSLSILEELRYLYRHHPDVPADTWLDMGTRQGARALGWEDSAGVLKPGAPGDLVVVPINQDDRHLGLEAMLRSTAPPVAVYISGVLQTRSGAA